MAYLANTILNMRQRVVSGYTVSDYQTIDYQAVNAYVLSLPAVMFDKYQVADNDKWERIALELYNNADYWDVLLVVNKRSPLSGLPFDFDTISASSADKILKYEKDVYKRPLSIALYDMSFLEYQKRLTFVNDINKVITIVKPTSMSAFLQGGYDAGVF